MDKPIWSMESEQSVIQAVVNNHERMNDFLFLNPDDFYHQVHKEVFALLLDFSSRGEFFDDKIISSYFGDEWGGFAYFIDIVKLRISDVNAVSYGRIVLDMSIRRKVATSYKEAIDKLGDSRVGAMSSIGDCETEVSDEIGRLSQGDNLSIDALIDHSVQCMEDSQTTLVRGVKTNIPEIDCQLGYRSMAYGEITAFGALPKNGKTLFANTVIGRCDLADDEVCLVFSIEMPEVGMFNGIVSAMSGVPSNFYDRQSYYLEKYPNYFDSWVGKWGHSAQSLRDSDKIIIDGKKDVTMNYIISEIRKRHAVLKNKGKKLRMVMIDHAHRIEYDTSKKATTYAMGDDARRLKNCAAELDIAVGLLVQLKEDCKDRDPTPYDILDTSRLMHEIQCFIGFRIHRKEGGTYFTIASGAHRYGDTETTFEPQHVKLVSGVIASLSPGESFIASQEE